MVIIMLTYKEACTKILEKYSDSEIVVGYQGSKFYLFAIKPKNSNKRLLDNYFTVDKKTGEVNEYSPVMNPSEFKEMLKHKC